MAEEEVAEARCALHPERAADGSCRRCGNFACAECNAAGFESGVVCITCAETALESRYHVVPLWRFSLFSLLTYGGYPLYWFWKNWSTVKKRDGSDIWPLVRAFFAGITYFMLLTDINTQLALRDKPRRLSSALGIGHLVFGGLHRLPDPYSLIALGGFAFLVPAVTAITELSSTAAYREGAQWRLRHTLLTIAAVPFFLLVTIGLLLPEEGP